MVGHHGSWLLLLLWLIIIVADHHGSWLLLLWFVASVYRFRRWAKRVRSSIHQLKLTRRRREQQYLDDTLFNQKSRTAMMVIRQVGADHRSQQLSSLLHSGRTRIPGSDVRYVCSRLREC